MNAYDGRFTQASTLPELEHLLVRAARRRATPRRGRRRWVLAIAAASLLLAAGATAAATGVLQIAGGQTTNGTFSIESRVLSSRGPGEHSGSICLQLRFNGGPPAYGCGERPRATKPFGLVIVDTLDNDRERVVYGLVSSDISRVSVLGDDSETDAVADERAGLPGRFFSVVTPNDGRIELVGYDAGGEELARLGRLEPQAHPPRSQAEARAQGDPAGFAPTTDSPNIYIYKGDVISPAKAIRLQLACLEGQAAVRCYDSVEEAETATRAKPR